MIILTNFELSLFFLVILICVSTDIGGYIFGKTFKGPRLTKISPKKTYSGAIGSFLSSLIFGIIYMNLNCLKLKIKFPLKRLSHI